MNEIDRQTSTVFFCLFVWFFLFFTLNHPDISGLFISKFGWIWPKFFQNLLYSEDLVSVPILSFFRIVPKKNVFLETGPYFPWYNQVSLTSIHRNPNNIHLCKLGINSLLQVSIITLCKMLIIIMLYKKFSNSLKIFFFVKRFIPRFTLKYRNLPGILLVYRTSVPESLFRLRILPSSPRVASL